MNFQSSLLSPASGADELRRLSVPLVMLTIGIGIFSMTIPIFLIHVFDKVLISGSLPTLLVLCLLGLVGLAAHGVFTFIRRQLTGRLGEALLNQLGGLQEGTQTLEKLNRNAFDREKRLAELIRTGVPIILLDMIVSTFSLGFTFFLSIKVGLAVLTFFPILWLNYEATRRKFSKPSPALNFKADTLSREVAVATFLRTTLQITVIFLAVSSVMAGMSSVGALIALLFLTGKCVGPVEVLCARLPLVQEFRSLTKDRHNPQLMNQEAANSTGQSTELTREPSTSQLPDSALRTSNRIPLEVS